MPLCRRVAARVAVHGQEVRYGLRHALTTFDRASGAVVPGPGERGLTCATCVLALCRSTGFELVDVASWRPRKEDGPWIMRVVRHIARRDPNLANDVAADGLCARFRPSEVAGACTTPPLPVPFDRAFAAASMVAERYDQLRPAQF